MFTAGSFLCVSLAVLVQQKQDSENLIPVHRIDHVIPLWKKTYALAVSQNGQFFAASDLQNVVVVYDIERKKAVFEVPRKQGAVTALAFDMGSRTLITAWDYMDPQKDEVITRVEFWDLTTRELQKERVVQGQIMAISGTGKFLVTRLSYNWRTIVATNLYTGHHHKLLHEARVMVVAVDQEGKQIAAATDESVSIWDVVKARIVRTLPVSVDERLGLDFSPDGKRLATWGKTRTAVRIWETQTGKESMREIPGAVFVRFLNQGKDIGCLSLKRDANVELWSVEHQRKYAILGDVVPRGNSMIQFLASSADGSVVVGGRSNGQVLIWQLQHREPSAAENK